MTPEEIAKELNGKLLKYKIGKEIITTICLCPPGRGMLSVKPYGIGAKKLTDSYKANGARWMTREYWKNPASCCLVLPIEKCMDEAVYILDCINAEAVYDEDKFTSEADDNTLPSCPYA